jgi:hypothetical protein
MFSRIQLYLFIGAAFILGAVGIYASGVQRGIDRTQRRIDKQRLDNIKTAKDVQDEVEILGDVDLARRAQRWVRNPDD